MDFNFDNVFELREEFEQLCKQNSACKDEYKKLVEAETKEEFMEVIYNNFQWVYNRVTRFNLEFKSVCNFYDGLARIMLNDKYGFINTLGTIVIHCSYDYAGDFCNGFAIVKSNEKYGFIDTFCKLIIPCIYDGADNFSDGFARVQLGEKWGFITPDGTLVVPCIYDYAHNFSNGLARVTLKGRWGLINTDGVLVAPCEFDSLDELEKFKDKIREIKNELQS